jgi:DNA polymerase-1
MPFYSLDVETTGLNVHLGDFAFSVQWCDEAGNAHYRDIMTEGAPELLALLADPSNEWVGHNIAFDLPFLDAYNLRPSGKVHDTMIMAHVHHCDEPSKGLKALAKKYLDRENIEEQRLEEWFMANGQRARDGRKYIMVPREIMEPYAKADVEMTMSLFQYYQKHGLLEDPVYQLEMRTLPVVIDIVRRGMKVDKEFAQREAERTAAIATALAQQAREQFGIENLASDAEISVFLFDTCKFECKKFTEKGNPRLDETALLEYPHPVVELILEYREAVKMNSTYLQPMLTKLDKEDRIHASLNQVGARTGRMSSSQPNLQNIPRSGGLVDIRNGFISRGDGWKLLLVDLSQIELRILAHYCKEPAMLDALATREGDLHAATAERMFGSREKKYRTIAKTLNFATIYGAGAKQLLRTLNKALPGAEFTLEQVKQFKRDYFGAYPMLQEFIWRVQGVVCEHGYVFDTFGRKYYCERDKAYRAVNYLIQGCSANVFKTSMSRVYEFQRSHDLRSCMINVIHDEFIFDLHDSEERLVPDIVRLIEDHTQFRVPIFANAAISSTHWSAKKDYSIVQAPLL